MRSYLFCMLLATLLLPACDSGGGPDPALPPGSLTVTSTLPDGTPFPSEVTVYQTNPATPDGHPLIHSATAMVERGAHTFPALPPGPYRVLPSRYHPGDGGPEVVAMLEGWVEVASGAAAHFEALFGYRVVESERWEAMQVFESAARESPWSHPRGRATVVRYDLAAIGVGDRHDVVRAVRTNAADFYVADEAAGAVDVLVYRVPEGVAWSSEDPGPLSYEFFREGLTPDAVYRVVLNEEASSHRAAQVDFAFSPATFFTARNGVAVLVEGREVMTPPWFHPLLLEYTWE